VLSPPPVTRFRQIPKLPSQPLSHPMFLTLFPPLFLLHWAFVVGASCVSFTSSFVFNQFYVTRITHSLTPHRFTNHRLTTFISRLSATTLRTRDNRIPPLLIEITPLFCPPQHQTLPRWSLNVPTLSYSEEPCSVQMLAYSRTPTPSFHLPTSCNVF
jgi:hypothetical protein